MDSAEALVIATLGQAWRIGIDSPIGRKESSLTFGFADGAFSGTMTDLFGAPLPISEIRLSGAQMAWRMDVTRPIRVSLYFEGEVAGRSVAGTIRSRYPDIGFSGMAPG